MRLSSDHIEALSFGAFQNCTSLEEPITVTYMVGDTDSDGTITILDATLIQNQLAEIPVSAFNEKAAIITVKSTFCKNARCRLYFYPMVTVNIR